MTYFAYRLRLARGESVALRHLGQRRHQPLDPDTIWRDWCHHDRHMRAAKARAA